MTELIGAINAGFGVMLDQTAMSMMLRPGDEAILFFLSFSVMLAWAEGGIVPLEEDWCCAMSHRRCSSDTATSAQSEKERSWKRHLVPQRR